MAEKFSQFTDGNQMQIGDDIVGLRAGINTRFDFPGIGFKDANGNYLLQYETAGAAALNYPQVTNSVASANVVYGAEGTDANIGITIQPKGTGLVTIANGLQLISQLDIDNLRLTGNTFSSINTNGDINITPDGTGDIVLDGVNWPQADGAASTILYTNGAAQLAWSAAAFPTTAGTSNDVITSNGTNWVSTSPSANYNNSFLLGGM